MAEGFWTEGSEVRMTALTEALASARLDGETQYAGKPIVFRVPAVPVATPRAKATTFNGRTRMYTPTSRKLADGSRKSNGVAEFKAQLRQVAASVYHGPPLTGPVRVDCLFLFPRQASKIWKSKPMPRYPHTTRPDRDNLDKMILDSLTGILWLNDWLVFAGTIEKWHAAGDEQPGVEIIVRGEG